MSHGAHPIWSQVLGALERHGKMAMVTLAATRGSSPREAGARMVVFPDGTFSGTIGGGALEWKALAMAQAALENATGSTAEVRGFALGPQLGQCCGGNVELILEVLDESQRESVSMLAARERQGPFTTRGRVVAGAAIVREIVLPGIDAQGDMLPGAASYAHGMLTEGFGDDRRPLMLFGAGHVGRALVLALAPLPFRVTWLDPRPDAFPAAVPANVSLAAPVDVMRTLGEASSDAFVLVMTHSHQLDLAIVTDALRQNRFPYVGLIGSRSKRVRFERRMAAAGILQASIAQLVCPIGIDGIDSKAPAVIAAATAAEMLVRDEALRAARWPHTDEADRRRA